MVQHFAYLPQRHVWFDRTKTLVTSQVFKEHAADLNVRTSSIRKCAQFIHESFLNSRPRGPVYSSRGWIRAKANAGAGGADRDRTGDPLLAKQVLSQLSYSPIDTREIESGYVDQWWVWEDSNHRPRPYQGRALTT